VDTRICDVDEGRGVDDLLLVCSKDRLQDPVHREGMAIKRAWLEEMRARTRCCARVAYRGDMPVAQILFYPEAADPTRPGRAGVLFVRCVWNSCPATRRLGIGRRLVESVLADAREGKLTAGTCDAVVTNAFDTGDGLSLEPFFERLGFVRSPEAACEPWETPMMLVLARKPPPSAPAPYQPLDEDRGRAVVFFDPSCQWSYAFAVKTRDVLGDLAPALPVDVLDRWKAADAFLARRRHWLIVNGKPILSLPMHGDRFADEIRSALGTLR
jgi:GNAT superfamily N-acetyltransferase